MPENQAASMTSRKRFVTALERKQKPDRIPHFELVFFLTMEVFGKVHPIHRNYSQWNQMSPIERQLHRKDIARLYIDIAEKFEQDAILIHPNPYDIEEVIRLIDTVRDICGDKYFLMTHGDATLAIPSGSAMEELSFRLADEPEKVHAELTVRADNVIKRAEQIKKNTNLDGFSLCNDYCFNSGPFLPLKWFDRFVVPHLSRIIKTYRDMGFYTIKHTDGNIMPILDRLVEARPDALHSLDPQAGVDIAELVKLVGDKITLCGNVNCGKLQTGTDEECIASAEYAIKHGKKAAGYIFCTSNCIYTGMELRRYELILNVWKKYRDFKIKI